MAINIFGFTIGKSQNDKDLQKVKSPVPPSSTEDGAITMEVSGTSYDSFLHFDSVIQNEYKIIQQYREMQYHHTCDKAINEVINEIISFEERTPLIEIDFSPEIDKVISEKIRNNIIGEFKEVLRLLNFKNNAYQLVRNWYVDGRIYLHALIDEKREKEGIKELRFIDPRQIKKIKEVITDMVDGVEISKIGEEYFLYNRSGMGIDQGNNNVSYYSGGNMQAYNSYKLKKDSVIFTHSGIVDLFSNTILSHLHQAIRPLNQLKMMEDASIIYRITRAPERRIFYIDTGSLPPTKAKQYIQNIISQYRNKLNYDQRTGTISDDKQYYSMQEDYFLARPNGSQGTSIDTLPGGDNLGEIRDIEYFQRQFYMALKVPIGRLDSQNQFNVGRVTEITRDEVAFSKFITLLRARFSQLFLDVLKKQLILKKIITPDEWEDIQDDINFIYSRDNYFGELKDLEILQARLDVLDRLEPHIGRFYSNEYVREHILQQSVVIRETIDSQIVDEKDDYIEKAEDMSDFDDILGISAELNIDGSYNSNRKQPEPVEDQTPSDAADAEKQRDDKKSKDKPEK